MCTGSVRLRRRRQQRSRRFRRLRRRFCRRYREDRHLPARLRRQRRPRQAGDAGLPVCQLRHPHRGHRRQDLQRGAGCRGQRELQRQGCLRRLAAGLRRRQRGAGLLRLRRVHCRRPHL